ncbi:hypothetical protein CRM22_005859 [Opisthorchis felineus]|uniref:polynucleotide adenylyltransferase n=1 Tax=Opisthorchis felineus TaxID=147828 RepID=A0A4S2LQH2_OPIFE|nr:hypothetical protein CRM22_005859 [Opisthorchis felineus]
MASFRRFSGGSESCWIHSKRHKPESKYAYLPEISTRLPDEFFCTQFNKSASSSTCTSEDSGIARTLNLSPHSPVLGDSDSEDSVSSDGLNVSQYTQKSHQTGTNGTLKFYPDHDFPNRPEKFNVAESAQFSPRCGMCVAATRDDPGQGDFGEKQSDNRFHIMSFEQVKGLHTLLTDSIPVHSRQTGCPTIWLRLSDLFQAVEENLKACGIPVRDIRINGGAASYILGSDSAPSYNDIDVLISVDLSSQSSTIQRVKSSVLDALMRFLPEDRGNIYSEAAFKNGNLFHGTQGQNISPTDGSENDIEMNSSRYFSTEFLPTNSLSRSPTPRGTDEEQQQSFAFSPSPICHLTTPLASVSDGYLRESYIYKQFRKYSTHEADCWSLLSLGMPSKGSKVVELKFVDRMRRQFEFTVDSFQISLSPILSFMRMYPNQPLTPNFAPTVVAESVAGSFSMALYHLKNKLIITKEPEMIRGGGLLKYCRLLVNGYQAPNGIDVGSLERYMSSRFFIDFQDIQSQKAKIEAFLTNHFKEDEDVERVNFLRTVHRVVSGSTICLMSFERYQTLHLICQLIDQYAKRNPIPSSAPSLDWFANQQNLTVDTIFYGTQYFPIISCSNSPRFSCCQWEQKSPHLCCESNEVRFSLGPSSSSSDSEFSSKYPAKKMPTSVDCPAAETLISGEDVQKSCSLT